MKIKEWLLDNDKRKKVITFIYRLALKKQPFHSNRLREQIDKCKFSDDIQHIWNQFDTLRAYYKLLLNQSQFANQVKLIRIIHENTMFHNKPELVAIERIKKEKQFKLLNENDQFFILDLLNNAIKNNNDQNRQRYPTLLHYINDKNSEKYDQKYTPPLPQCVECQNLTYLQAYQYLQNKDLQKQSIKKI
ncbi:unnamed protein product [Paramecium primaurelia]|uniref:Uncharacterized protein n=2 Tax=Paramecium TaxID=5884 RepID=A0A8S1UUE2_9CILI|nr:unnamed protein product [Paramecium primaurelia]CAD8167462.1 unnamed protein product [Paramecium pentaurelia]